MGNAFYKQLTTDIPKKRNKIEKETAFVETVRDNLEDYNNEKYVAAIASLKLDIEDLSFWTNMITYTGIMITILVSFVSPEDSNVGAAVVSAVFITFSTMLLALKRFGLRSKYVKLLTVLENSKDHIKNKNAIIYNFDIEIDDKVIGNLKLKEDK